MKTLRLKKSEDRRIRGGHPWVYSNEIDTAKTPFKSFTPGQEIIVESHGGTLLGAGYVNPHSLIAVRLFSRDSRQSLDLDFLTNRLAAALALRQRLFQNDYYRLVFSEADGLPGLIADRYGAHLVIQINTAGMETKKPLLVEAIKRVIPDIQSILLRNESPIREQEGLSLYTEPLLGQPPVETEIEENGVRFIIPLWKGQKTGWFYDHRPNRARLKAYAAGKTVLDVFCYLGGFGVQAAAFGAAQVDCIESSRFACDFIERNADLNQVSKLVHVIQDDAFDAMKQLNQSKKKYDIIILDPPAFVKRTKDHKEGLLAYQRINELALKLLTPGGILISCSCSMHVSMEELLALIQRAATRIPCTLQVIERGHQGPDHPVHPAIPESDYLKAIVMVTVP